jgi:hypothetical protein
MAESNDISMPANHFEELVAPEVEIPKTVSAKAAFMAKCLHPPSAVNGFEGLPTNDTRSQVTVEYKGIFLSQASAYAGNAPTSLITAPAKRPTSFAFLVVGGGIRFMTFSFFKDTDNGQWYQDIPNTIVNNTYDVERVSYDVNLYRPTYKSITQSLNTTMFNNTGMVVGNSFNPPLLWAGTTAELAEKYPTKFRHYVKHLFKTCMPPIRRSKCKHFNKFPASVKMDILEIVKNSISNNDDSDRGFQHLSLDDDPITIDLDPSATIQFIFFGEAADQSLTPVPTMDQMLNNDTRSATYPAREGAFVVSRLNTISPAWLVPTNGTNQRFGLYQCYCAYIDKDGQYHFVQLYDRGEIGGPVQVARDVQWAQDISWSWIQYQGLSYNSNQDVVTQQQLLATKFIAGYEYQPAFLSPFAGLQHLSPKPDLMAMESLLREFYGLKSILPAKYNFLGMLARGASKLLPFIVKHAGTIAKGINSVAELGDDETKKDARMRNSAVMGKPARAPKERKRETKVLRKIDKDIRSNKPQRAERAIKQELAKVKPAGRRPATRGKNVVKTKRD